jgi:hypothetical protein
MRPSPTIKQGNELYFAHYFVIDNGKLKDSGISGEECDRTVKAFFVCYRPQRVWRIDQITEAA